MSAHVVCCDDHDRTLCGSPLVYPTDEAHVRACAGCLRMSFSSHCPLGKECGG